MTKLFLFALLALIVLTSSDCKKDIVNPPPPIDHSNDTTSHEFMWQIDTLGDGNSSMLYDVAVINDTLAYAVGSIYLRDSTGHFDHNSYNVAKWNGRKWELKRILVRDFGTGTGYFPLYTVFAFNEKDVWFASAADLIHWDGFQFTAKAFFATQLPFTGQVRKIWGTSGSNLYCVGQGGAIYHYTGATWNKIESGITTPIYDIWGSGEKIYCAASNMWKNNDAKILTISPNEKVDSISWQSNISIGSIWLDEKKSIYVCGAGVFKNESGVWKEQQIPNYYYGQVRGSASNNVFAVGVYGMTVHYNGITWKNYPELMIDGWYDNLDVKDNIMCAVGDVGNKAVAVTGKRK